MITKFLNHYSYAYQTLPKFRAQFRNSLINSDLSSRALLCLSNINSNLTFNSSFRCFCSKNENSHQVSSQRFSALGEDIPWDNGNLWSSMAFYLFTLHIPLSFGWMSVAAEILQQPDLDPQTQAISLLVAQILELTASLILLNLTAKQQHRFEGLFKPNRMSEERNWLLASAIGFGFLFALVVITSFLVGRVLEPKSGNNPIVKEILVHSNISKAACVFVYCFTAPFLEEAVYRGFLLRSLSTTMQWQQAVLISSAVFSAAHFSGENFVQLFIIGCVLGCSYCWTGNLCSSFAIHSLYNAMTLIISFLS